MNKVTQTLQNMSKKQKVSLSVVAAALLAGGIVVGCGGGGGGDSTTLTPLTPDPVISATTELVCDGVFDIVADVADYNVSDINISVNVTGKADLGESEDFWRQSPNAANTLVRMSGVLTDAKTAGGDTTDLALESQVHPTLISYAEQVIGGYELGDGSADIGDPTHLDEIFVSLSRDDGKTWKKYQISDSTDKNSTQVTWDGATLDYPGHNVKPTMAAYGNKILVAWHSKYCPSGNPMDLVAEDDGSYPTDFFKINGTQGSINYANEDGTPLIAPNDKEVWEVPFSCIWVARGIYDANDTDNTPITWMKPEQVTSGNRDANKVTIAASEYGFALTWQEDVEGLREGKAAGPGEGWSGSTTNHGSDIWYSMITMDDFVLNEADGTRPTPSNKFTYPVRITDNEMCNAEGDTKLYCQAMCDLFGTGTVEGSDGTYCQTGDVDALVDKYVVLNGDTGASRPVITVMKTTGDPIVVLGYEETKGLSDNGTVDDGSTPIELEGKSVYYEAFPFKKYTQPTTKEEFQTLVKTLPMVSSGSIINIKVPEVTFDKDTNTTTVTSPTKLVYENARRLTLIAQADNCPEGKYTFGWLYKQGIFTQGDSSDMFVRLNTSFSYDTLEQPVNVSSNAYMASDSNTSEWTTANLNDQSSDNIDENTFSPRAIMRGNHVYIGYEYTPRYITPDDEGYSPNNFYVIRMKDGIWQRPYNVTRVYGDHLSTLDPRFITTATPKNQVLTQDAFNDEVFFVTFGTLDVDTGIEQDLYYVRSADKGETWVYDPTFTIGATPAFKLANKEDVEEKEVQSFSTPDGLHLYNAWLSETETFTSSDTHSGLDTWFGRVDWTKP